MGKEHHRMTVIQSKKIPFKNPKKCVVLFVHLCVHDCRERTLYIFNLNITTYNDCGEGLNHTDNIANIR